MEPIIFTDEAMKAHIAAGLKQMEDERIKVGLELYTGEVGAFYSSDTGAELSALDNHEEEFKEMINDMFEKLPAEKKLLEGTIVPEYNPIIQNGFSNGEPTIDQWKSVSPSGCLTTGPILTSLDGSSNSACIAMPLVPSCPMESSDEQSVQSSGDSCSENLDDCGNGTGVTNESSECTVPMISEQTDGTRNEVKWSPPLKSMVSSDPTLPGERL
jgi:hypothetical protein